MSETGPLVSAGPADHTYFKFVCLGRRVADERSVAQTSTEGLKRLYRAEGEC